MGHVRTVPENMFFKFEVRIFSHIGTSSIKRPKIYGGHLTRAPTPIRKIFKSHVWTVPKNMPAKFGVRSFNRFGIINTYSPKN